MINILLAEDDEIMRITLFDRLSAQGWQVDQAGDGDTAFQKLKHQKYHVLISDIRMPGLSGIDLMKQVRHLSPTTEVILMTAYGEVEDAVNCLKYGAADYILKPFDMDDLIIRAERILKQQTMRNKCAVLMEEKINSTKIIGNSRAIKAIYDLISQVAPTDSTVLITGESGTGKELVASAIHEQSSRADGPYIRINCAAIPENLIESELFGHVKGSFTGADSNKTGKFELADRGTILLDEIGDMPLPMQAKLLRVIQENEIEPIGAKRPVQVDVRIISATARDLPTAVQNGTFREDLLYRLKVIPVVCPPLREHKEDIPLLCQHFLSEVRPLEHAREALSPDILDLLMGYDFPGNIRELKNIIERLAVLSKGPVLDASHLPTDVRQIEHSNDKEPLSLAEALAKTEKECIQKALYKTNGNKTEAAKLLGISRKSLWERMKGG